MFCIQNYISPFPLKYCDCEIEERHKCILNATQFYFQVESCSSLYLRSSQLGTQGRDAGQPKRVTSDFCGIFVGGRHDGVFAPLLYRHRRDWTVNEPARRTNHCGDSPRASLLASRASSFYRIGRSEDGESEREKRESLRRLNGLRVDPDFTVFRRYRSPFSSSSPSSLLLSSFLHGDF